MPCDDFEIISKRSSNDLGAIKIVAIFVFKEFDVGDDGLENDEENYTWQGISLKYSPSKLKKVRFPIFGDYFTFQFWIEVWDVINEVIWDIVVFETNGDETMANTPKGILKIVQFLAFLMTSCTTRICSIQPLIPWINAFWTVLSIYPFLVIKEVNRSDFITW